MRLKDKVALITGSNSGVGVATAKLFASEGAKVIICARREEALLKVKEELVSLGNDCLAVKCDISKEEDVTNLFNEIIKKYGRIDILVNNAGVLDTDLNSIERYLDSDFIKVININQKGTMQVTREALKYMCEVNKGTIVNVASVAGELGCGGAVYVASKGAIIALTKHTAMRFAGTEIRCNAICPGNIHTPMTNNMDFSTINMAMLAQMGKHADLKGCKSCEPIDVANIILFLSSDESKAITGQVIISDFGADL